MKRITLLFVIIPLIYGENLAQGVATATMRVTATIISGATLTNIETINIDFSDTKESTGHFEFIAQKNIDTHISVENSIIAKNEFGDELTLSSNSTHEGNEGVHSVDFSAKILEKDNKDLRGNYFGSLKTTINYL